VLLWAAFVTLVHKKFSPTWSRDKVIRFVADARASLGEEARQVDALVAENLIRRALGDESLQTGAFDNVDDEVKARAQLVVLMALVADADLDESALDELLDSARELTSQWQ